MLSQLAEINKINISPKETDDTTSKKENLLEFEKNDQLISRSDSEFRLFVILGILSIIENLVLLIITIFLSQINQSNLIDVDIQVQFPQPHLKAIYRNGSVYSSYFKEGSFLTSEYEFDLPANADYYFYFEYRQRYSYIHGNGYQNHFHQTFESVHGKGRQRKHTFSSKFGKELWFDGPYMKSGHNSSIVQIGNTLMLFGGGKDKKSDGKVFQSSTSFHNCQFLILCWFANEAVCDADVSDCWMEDIFGGSQEDCNCFKNVKIHFWSMEKEIFIPSTNTLPFGFGFLTGCTASLDKNKVLLIGGHHVKTMFNQGLHEFLVKHPANNKVLEFNIETRKWTVLPNVPLLKVILLF